jgi:hypothetical protein
LDVCLFVPQKPQATTRSTAAPRRLANGVYAHKIKKESGYPFLFSKVGRRTAHRQAAARADGGTHTEKGKIVTAGFEK